MRMLKCLICRAGRNAGLIFISFLFVLLTSGCQKGKRKILLKSEKSSNNIEVVLSDDSDDFLVLGQFDYDKASNSIYAPYLGMQANMHFFYYKLSLNKPYSIEIMGSRGQGPDKISHPIRCVRVFAPFMMIADYNEIKVFDKNGSFVNNIGNLPFYPTDFFFKNGVLSVLVGNHIFQDDDSTNIFLSYDIGEKKVLKGFSLKEIKNVFTKNGVNFKLLKQEDIPFFTGRVLNEYVAVIKISGGKVAIFKNSFVIADLSRNKMIFFRPKPFYKYSIFFQFSGVAISSVEKKTFLLIEAEYNIPFNKVIKMSEKDRTKLLKRSENSLMFCIHRVNLNGEELAVYPFIWKKIEDKVYRVSCWDLIEIKPSLFFMKLSIVWKNGKMEQKYVLWNAKQLDLKNKKSIQ